jgi:hypothetical protein
MILNICLVIGIIACIAALRWIYKASIIKDLDEFIEENYIISDPGDEVEHIYRYEKKKNE